MTTELSGRYVQIFVECAADISSVFEEKTRRVLASNGIREISTDEWYDAVAFARALHEIGEAAGPEMLESVGSRMVWASDPIVSTDDPESAFEVLSEFAVETAHRGPKSAEVVAFETDRLGPREYRVGTGPGYHYPEAYAHGVFRATVAAAADVPEESITLDPVATEGEERHAFVLSW
ncbi:MAG: hypothetical protein ABEI99_08745 [Halobaculum sp.]